MKVEKAFTECSSGQFSILYMEVGSGNESWERSDREVSSVVMNNQPLMA